MTLWYTARAAGLAALILLTASTVLGALVSRRTGTAHASDPGRRYIGQYLHRALAGLGLVVLLVHVGTIVADSYVDVGLTGALVPFASGYRTVWVAVGTIAFYLLAGVAVLGAARGRMATSPRGARIWRGLHTLAYAGWAAAILHGVNSGTDSSVGWVRAIYLACLATVIGAAGYRVVTTTRDLPATVDSVLDGATDRPDRFAGRPASASVPRVRIGAGR